MESWNSIYDGNPNIKKLPYFSGTKVKGYTLAGYTLIDANWYEYCSKLLWFKSKYYVKCSLSADNMKRLGKVKDKPKNRTTAYLLLHRLILGLSGQVKDVIGDHISGDKLDNRFCNLRMASTKGNSANSRLKANNKSGYIGVDILPSCPNNPYRVRLYRDGNFVLKEFHPTVISAAQRYDSFLRENYPSEFNRYNFPLEGEQGVKD
jgi:hypothetical protein